MVSDFVLWTEYTKCTNFSEWNRIGQNGTSFEGKVIHNLKPGNAEKMSYTRSYSHYPQKSSTFFVGKSGKKQTGVL